MSELVGYLERLQQELDATKKKFYTTIMSCVNMIETLESKIEKDPKDKEIQMYLRNAKDSLMTLMGYSK